MGEAERSIDKWRACFARLPNGPPRVFADLIALHIDDLTEVGKPIRSSKLAVMNALKVSLGRVKIQYLTRERSELSKAQAPYPRPFVRTALSHAAAVYGIDVPTDSVRLARIALMHLDLIGRSDERDRRPSPAEWLTEYGEANPRQFIPLARIIRFAVATAMRQGETHRMDRRGFAETYRENSGRVERTATIKLSHCSTQPVTMPGRSCLRSGSPLVVSVGCSRTTPNRSEQRSIAPARNWISKTYVFTTFDTKEQAVFSKLGLRSRRWRW